MASTSVRSLREEAFKNARAFANQSLRFFACKFRVAGKAGRGPYMRTKRMRRRKDFILEMDM